MDRSKLPFKTGWFGFKPPLYRTDDTHCFGFCQCPYEALSPIPTVELLSKFHWVEAFQDRYKGGYRYQPHKQPSQVELNTNLERLISSLTSLQLTLPETFVNFMRSPDLKERMPYTHNYFCVPDMIRESTIFEGLFFLPFLKQSGSGETWYLCFSRDGDSCIFMSFARLEEVDPLSYYLPSGKQVTVDDLIRSTIICAPTFEGFLYRHWLESHILLAFGDKLELTPLETEYLAHYGA